MSVKGERSLLENVLYHFAHDDCAISYLSFDIVIKCRKYWDWDMFFNLASVIAPYAV